MDPHQAGSPEDSRRVGGGRAMNAWLDAHVGPSTLEPDGFFG